MTPEEFLDRREARARRELRRSLERLGHALDKTVGLSSAIRRHPLLSLVGAVAAGFFLGKRLSRFSVADIARRMTGPALRPLLSAARSALVTLAGAGGF